MAECPNGRVDGAFGETVLTYSSSAFPIELVISSCIVIRPICIPLSSDTSTRI